MIRFNSEGGFTQDAAPESTTGQLAALRALTERRPNKYQLLHRAGLLAGTIKSCQALRAKRNEANPPAGVTFGRFAGLAAIGRRNRSVKTVVPLGATRFLAEAKAAHPMLREWSLGALGRIQTEGWSLREIGSNSDWHKRSTFQRGIAVQSYATCTDFRVCVLHLAGAVHTIRAPRGWRWDIDQNGFRLRSCSDARIDYHPTAAELTGDVAELPKLARAGFATRQAAAKAAKAKAKADAAAKAADAAAVARAEAVGVMVCLADSVRAGNCRAGSETFARNHGLDPKRHYSPAEVLAAAHGQTRFVALACTAALRRTIRELDRGYSELAEHRV